MPALLALYVLQYTNKLKTLKRSGLSARRGCGVWMAAQEVAQAQEICEQL
jgi:hypothetical protein